MAEKARIFRKISGAQGRVRTTDTRIMIKLLLLSINYINGLPARKAGVPDQMRRHLAQHTRVCKFNVGTELRQCFGAGLRAVLADDPALFDRGQILRATRPGLTALAAEIMRSFT